MLDFESLNESEMNTLATIVRDEMEKESAKGLVDLAMRLRDGSEHTESILLGAFAVFIEKADQDQLLAFAPLIFLTTINLLDSGD